MEHIKEWQNKLEKYVVSVVIPVYNCENYIEECVNSICKQDYSELNKIQVLLINDGSTDHSLEKCYEIKKKEKSLCIEVISSKNEGVSSARNKGINAAKGKYILFLDADDFISGNTISQLVNFFDKHYEEVDLVTYPLERYDMKTGKRKVLPRYKDSFVHTKVYDLQKEYYAIQPSINVMIKNLYEQNILFDDTFYFHEDTLFNTEILMKKQKIGYVSNATYTYRVYGGDSTTDYKENPLYSFDQYMTVFEYLFDKYKDANNRVPLYIQRLALNVIRYRLLTDKLFPYYLEGKEWNKAYGRIVDLVKKIDNKTIIQYREMNKYHKLYLISFKEQDLTIKYGYNGEFAISDDQILYAENSIEIIINRLKAKNGKIYILGYLKSILLNYAKPNLYIQYINNNGEVIRKELNLKESNASLYWTRIKVANFYEFECVVDENEVQVFGFKVELNHKDLNVRYYFNKYAPFNSKVKNYTIYDNNYRVHFEKNQFYIDEPAKRERIQDWKENIKRYKKINNRINLYRRLAELTRKKNKKIWLYIDRNNIFDNGYSQFKHDIKIKDNIEKYYIIDNKKKGREKFTINERTHVVKYGSFKHKLLFLNSDKILTSFSSLSEYCPFQHNYPYYKDILKYDLVYLQHGILHAKLVKMYSKIFTQIDKFVVSSQFEKDSLISTYGYSEGDLIQTGMPRLDDNPMDVTKAENRIIYAPSWRQYLIGEPIDRKRKLYKDKFISSKYYRAIIDFLNNEDLLETLEKNNIILDFKLHPIFEGYKECFGNIESKYVKVSIGNVDLNRYKAFITDFSSFQFDFVNLKRPIAYFVPDMDEFKAGLHTYRELSLSHEDAFGKLLLSGDKMAEEVIRIIHNNFTVEEPYKTRMENFFFEVDHRKDKLYEILKNS